MAISALAVYAGREAATRLAERGWDADLFDLLIGASGGPKWFVLSQLDRVLFSKFLSQRSRPLATLGSSIGSWRHACFATRDPAAAIARMEAGYLYQRYSSERPSVAEISEVSLGILQNMLSDQGAADLLLNDKVHTHVVTARGRGFAAASHPTALASGMGMAALGNAVSRELLRLSFQRVVFHTGEGIEPPLHFHDFDTCFTALTADNLIHALHASGAIPFLLTGERNIPGGPPGQYWDGGMIDYHFDLDQHVSDGLILYPHFSARLVPGWFDKFLPWRQTAWHRQHKLVLLCPSARFVADLPYGKIPDRNDFRGMGEDERMDYWEICVERCKALAEEFMELISGSDPLRGVTLLD
ncbi:MAG: patatin-like phospholipase family protein [Pseudomonadota bacterium]